MFFMTTFAPYCFTSSKILPASPRLNWEIGMVFSIALLTALKRVDANTEIVKIPNDEVMSEFQVLVAEFSGVSGLYAESFEH